MRRDDPVNVSESDTLSGKSSRYLSQPIQRLQSRLTSRWLQVGPSHLGNLDRGLLAGFCQEHVSF